MEEMNKRELDLWEMDKVSGGAGGSSKKVYCAKCGKKLKSLGSDKYWCTNEDCKYYHVEVRGTPAFRDR